MARIRTTKTVARRHDLQYFAKPHPWRRARKLAVFLCALAAIGFVVAFAGIDKGRTGLVHNPGHVTLAHASFENDCIKCHDGDGKGGFLRTISDNACLQCHDAPLHHPNQATFIALRSANGASDPHAGMDGTAGPASTANMRSADCIACHTEHRGHDALVGTDNLHCTRCHGDLNSSTVKKPTAAGVWTSVTAFDATHHPHFGRKLVASVGATPGGKIPDGATPVAWAQGPESGAWSLKSGQYYDPTNLRYNHAKHASLIPPLAGQATNCTVCHSTDPVEGHALNATPADAVPPPPYLTPDDAGAYAVADGATFRPPAVSRTNTDDRRYTHQVSFARDCAGCHRLDLRSADGKSFVEIPHEQMALVRAKILSLSDEDVNRIFPMPAVAAPADPKKPAGGGDNADTPFGMKSRDKYSLPGDMSTALAAADDDPFGGAGEPAAPKAGTAGAAGGGGDVPDSVTTTTLKKWSRVVGGQGADQLKKLQASLGASAKDPKRPLDRRALLFYVVYAAGNNSCVKCHETAGDITTGFDAASGGPATQPAAAAAATAAFMTMPTGIPHGPRRWFVGSDFNHDAHRDMSCLDCHAKAETSSLTSDVLSPDLDGQLKNAGVPADAGTAPAGPMHATVSCVSCHHADTRESRGSGVNCVECHKYHDRTLEVATRANAMVATASPEPPK